MASIAIRAASILVAALFLLAAPLAAIEIGVEARSGNVHFPWNHDTPVPASVTQFPATNFFFGGAAWFSASLGEDAVIRVAYDRDPVLRNTLIASVLFERGIAKIAVGPLVGFMNTDSTPVSAGLSANVALRWPGTAYVSIRSDGGLALSVLQTGNDPQARTELAAGFYVPNAIVSGVMVAKRFNETDSHGDLIATDSFTRYALNVDIYKKNVPYTLLATVGYEVRSKKYVASDSIDTIGSVVVGATVAAQISEAYKLTTEFSTGFYTFGLNDLKNRGPSGSDFLFSAAIGLVANVDAIKSRPKSRVPAPAAKPASAEGGPAGGEAAAEAAPSAPPKRLAIDVGGGLHYTAAALPSDAAGVLGPDYNLRGAAWTSIQYRITPSIAAGGEMGLQYITTGSDAGGSTDLLNLVDVPLLAKFSYSLGSLAFDLLGGIMVASTIEPGPKYGYDLGVEAGLRARWKPLYVEGVYVVGLGGAKSFPRAGFGVWTSLR